MTVLFPTPAAAVGWYRLCAETVNTRPHPGRDEHRAEVLSHCHLPAQAGSEIGIADAGKGNW